LSSVNADGAALRQIQRMKFPELPGLPMVVIVDDDAAVREALAFTLELEGFAVAGLETGEALLRQSLPVEGACLLIDERLPGISGLEALLRLRARRVTLPAILMTSHPDRLLRAAAHTAGVPILEKPLFAEVLTLAVRAALRS
jgi:FixJ family two-component response regulator